MEEFSRRDVGDGVEAVEVLDQLLVFFGFEGAAHRLIPGADGRAVFFDNGVAGIGQAHENLAFVGLALDQLDQALLAQVRQGAADQRAVGAEQLGEALHVLGTGLAQPQQDAEVHEAEVGDQREQLLGLRLHAVAEAEQPVDEVAAQRRAAR